MKFCLALLIIAASFAFVHGESLMEHFDIDTILLKDDVLKEYVKCVMGQASCTPEGKEIKELIRSVIETGCKTCTPNERKLIRKAAVFVYNKYPEDFENVLKIMDPKGEATERVMKFVTAN